MRNPSFKVTHCRLITLQKDVIASLPEDTNAPNFEIRSSENRSLGRKTQ